VELMGVNGQMTARGIASMLTNSPTEYRPLTPY